MEEPKTKSVLVTYLERNKVLKIADSNDSSDVKRLEGEFRKEFKFDSNVRLIITFQRYDRDWEEFVDLDDECTLLNKDKLKAVVTPLLATPTTEISEVNTATACNHTQPSILIKLVEPFIVHYQCF
jgi:hypothetical protein